MLEEMSNRDPRIRIAGDVGVVLTHLLMRAEPGRRSGLFNNSLSTLEAPAEFGIYFPIGRRQLKTAGGVKIRLLVLPQLLFELSALDWPIILSIPKYARFSVFPYYRLIHSE